MVLIRFLRWIADNPVQFAAIALFPLLFCFYMITPVPSSVSGGVVAANGNGATTYFCSDPGYQAVRDNATGVLMCVGPPVQEAEESEACYLESKRRMVMQLYEGDELRLKLEEIDREISKINETCLE